ncbi:tetraspanin Pls1 family [Heliocybe sulcata]|uniref:Tetraspanin Pls1 family n=1 Tax=Heliocybe sulcata TaxID=5364 RepID=A0A5C3NB26_9AGAM|nr:tetraspanin Pls1 family [Heliocybe sulcata]
MVSKKLMGVWAFVDFCLLVAGVISIAVSIVWKAPNLLLNMVFSKGDLTAGTVLGVALLITFAFSIGAIVQRNHVTIGLVILNWILVLDAIGIAVIGTFVWAYTLQERANYHEVFVNEDNSTIIAIQDKLSCCGYFNGSDRLVLGGSFCQNQTFVDSFLQFDNTTMTWTGACVAPITAFADSTLNNVFTSVYGFMAVVICLFLGSLCVIKKRQEEERFSKIDAKRGGRGFV